MIFSFDKKNSSIEMGKKTDFSSHNILERLHIEKWIETNPDILGEDLLILTNEFDRFDKTNERLDLLAIDRDGNIVVVELKRDDSGKNVDLQALKYAAYCSTLTLDKVCQIHLDYLSRTLKDINFDSIRTKILQFIINSEFEDINDKPRIILVSKDYRQEVTASVLWLRKFNLDIKCIKLTPYELADNKIVIEANTIIPLPEAVDYIIQTEQKESQIGNISVSRKEYLDFYNDISAKLNKHIDKVLSAATAKNYYQISTGIGGVHFEWAFHGRPRNSFGVELHFERGDSAYNKDLISKIAVYKDKIEKATKETLIIQENWGQKWSRLYLEINEGEITDKLKDWAVEKMKIFIETIQPILDNEK